MDSKVTVVLDGEETILVLDKKLKQLSFSATITEGEKAGVTKLCHLICSAPPNKSDKLKRRAQRLLRTIFSQNRELFVLCGLATTFTSIAQQTKSDAGVARVLAWFGEAKHPPALKELEQTLLSSANQTFETIPSLSGNNTIQQDAKSTPPVESQIPSPSRNNTIQKDTKSTPAVDSQIPSTSRSNAVQEDIGSVSAYNSRPPKKRAWTNTGLAANPVDIQDLQECRTIVERLYPTHNVQQLRSLSREQLISLLNPSSQDLTSHGPSLDLSTGSQSSASSPKEDQRTPRAELPYEAYTSNELIHNTAQTSTLISNLQPSNTGLVPNNSLMPCYAYPLSKVLNLRRKNIFDFFTQFIQKCGPWIIQNSGGFSLIALWKEGSREYDMQFSIKGEICDSWRVVLGHGNGAETSSITISSQDLFTLLQVGPDPGPLELVMAWSTESYLPEINIPEGTIMMRPNVGTDLVAYSKRNGLTLEYWENKDLNMEGNIANYEGEYTPP